jgi:ATP-binding cassette subfamily F protein 3
VARLHDVHKSYGTNTVYAGLDFAVERGQRVALVGVNGAGKSTLLKMLAGVLPPDRGERALGAHVQVHYYAQHQLDALDPSHTVLEELEVADPESALGRLRNILGSFLFSGDQVDKRISVLSGGEKARVALAKMLVRPAALLCMDEPTNHLDLASKEVLEDALVVFNGTIVFISHDRYFINRIATHVVEVDRGRLTTHLGNYDEYLERKSGAPPPPAPAREKPPAAEKPKAAPPSRSGSPRGSRKGLEREIKVIKGRLEAIESQIAAMERRLEEIGLALAAPDLYRDGERAREIAQSRKDAEQQVAWLMKEWEELSLRLSAASEEA